MHLEFYGRNLIVFVGVMSTLSTGLASLQKSSKIITKEGNVILEAGINKNISIELNGRSRLLVNNLDLLDLFLGVTKWSNNSTSRQSINGESYRIIQDDINNLKSRLLGRGGLNFRLRRIQNRTISSNQRNQLLLRAERSVTNLENKVEDLIRKLKLENCKSNPCENGGSCVDVFDGFLCKCTNGFEGQTCTTDVNECALFAGTYVGCQNGGQCINQFGSYNCICKSGWQGIHCRQRKTDCLHSTNVELCDHGTCVNANDNFGYSCLCEQGWKSNGLTPSCTVDIDECKEYTSSCSTKCINLPGGFTCAPCEPGYTGNGLSCRDIDECSTDNGGCSVTPFVECINTYGSFHCGECPVGWIGDGRLCTRKAGQACARNNICHRVASCQEISERIVCSCPVGMTGHGFGPNGCLKSGRNTCASNPCLNGGICMDTGNASYICVCPMGFRLPNCERVNQCATNRCLNGGTCRPNDVSFSCLCVAGYGGRLCDSQISLCGQYISSDQGNLKYPLNNLYNHNSQCSWVIRTDEDKVLNITFSKFEIRDSLECRFNWLQIHDGSTAASQLIGRFCGSMAPRGGNVISTTNRIYIQFKTDNSTALAGFDLSWTSIDPICGGIVKFDSQITISSPGSPGNYPRNSECKWHLMAPNINRIRLVFSNLQIENHSSCNYDYLEISDVISGKRLQIFCNSSIPAPFTAASNEILVHFHSDNESSDLGFQIHVSVVEHIPGCGGTYTNTRGIILSPRVFEGSISCEYNVQYPKGIKVQLEVFEFVMGDDECIEIFDVDSGNKGLSGRWCGKMNVPIFESAGNEAQINYYSKGGTFNMGYRTICKNILEESSGVITSPNYPNPYKSDEACVYEIIGDPNQVVSLEFIDMDLESHQPINACSFQYIQITDGNNETAGGPFCGTIIPPKMVSSTSLLKITLVSDNTFAGRGFMANYTLIMTGDSCGGVLRKSSGEIKLPLSSTSGLYQHDFTCIWTIIAPVDYAIQLFWLSFKLEYSKKCVYDYLAVYNTEKITDGVSALGRFCGNAIPPAFLSATNTLTLKFQSDSNDADDGFIVKYNFIEVSSLCGGHLSSSNGRIRSPNWPNEYPNDLNCTWVITGPMGHQIELIVAFMKLEDSQNCINDWIEIRKGGSGSSPLIGKFCGKTIPKRFTTFTHQIQVNFRTNSLNSGSGFQIQWQTVAPGCGGFLSSDHGSAFYPLNYGDDLQCEWRISVNKGSTISMKFEDLTLISVPTCSEDFIDIYDGPTDGSRRIGRYCVKPDNNAFPIETTGSDALIRFQTDWSNTDRGFYLSYESNCNQILCATRGAIESPNFGDNNPSDVNCTWTIQAPKGNHILLDFVIVGQKVDGLKSDYVYFKESNNDTVIRITEPKRIESHDDTVQIWVNSSSKYFRMEYGVQGCVGNFHRPNGEFTSPEYPNPYPNNMECLWQIETDIGSAIELVFTHMEMEDSINCTHDGIKVWNSAQRIHLISTFCGKRDNLTLTSTGHTMLVQFYSDASANGKGFTAMYRTVESKCGGKYKYSQGAIQSPHYPRDYDSNLHCEWLIQVSEHSTMTLTVEELDLESSYKCLMDALKIYNGPNANTNAPWQKLCGRHIPDTNVFQTTSNTALLVFDTDYDIQFKGFIVSFKENCGNRIIVNDTGRIRFAGSDQQECSWVFVAEDMSKHITFTTTHIVMTPVRYSQNMTNDDECNGVMIFDGEFTNTSSIRPKQTFCFRLPPSTTSFGHALTIKLSPSIITEFEGTYTILDNNCGDQFNSLHGTFTSPSYPRSYPINIECIWEIVANDGNSLILTIQSMNIDKTEDCNADYLEIREGCMTGRLIGTFCGDDAPDSLITQKSLWIKFNSDDDNVGRGFIAEYSYAFHSDLNGTGGIIESPKYPSLFTSSMEHTWRISVPSGMLILLTFEYFLRMYEGYTKFYNGYDDQAESIEYTNTQFIQSDTNTLYMKSTQGVFRLIWDMVSIDGLVENSNCSKNIITVGTGNVMFQSPGFPHGYASNLNCNWIIVPSDLGTHVTVAFDRINLEDDYYCNADRVFIYSSIDMINWKQLDQICQMKLDKVLHYSGDKFLKVQFISDFGINKTGFSAVASTLCGSTLTDPSGTIDTANITSGDTALQLNCVWKIQVKAARRIKLTFLQSELEMRPNNSETPMCRTYVLLKNGISEDSPNLGNGTYCDSNLPENLTTTSNHAYVKINFERSELVKQRFVLKYEEVMDECMHIITLDEYHTFEVLKFSNNPKTPSPLSMCSWIIRSPVHRLIAVNFADPMNLYPSDMCHLEYIELYDGATELSPVIGRFCGKTIPNTQHSSGNILRIKFFTDIAFLDLLIEFTANVSLAVCGGTYRMLNGIIYSPKTLGLRLAKGNFSCEYTISVPTNNAINLTVKSIDLPLADNCSEVSHLRITPIYADEENESNPILICGGSSPDNIIINTHKVQIIYHIRSTDFNHNSFRLTYLTIGNQCGQTIEAASGILISPGYRLPLRSFVVCIWKLKVPDGRRIKIEFLEDITVNIPQLLGFRKHYRLVFANDFEQKSIITQVDGNPPPVLYSSDNLMSVKSLEIPTSHKLGFKLRFSSDEESLLCNANFDKVQGDIHFQSPENTSVYCRYDINVRENETLVLTLTHITANQSIIEDFNDCKHHEPVTFRDLSGKLSIHWFCNSRIMNPVLLPYPVVILDILSNTINKLTSLDLKFIRHNCGGMFTIGDQFQLMQPSTLTANYGAMDCAWLVLPNPGDLDQFEVTLSVDFKLKCNEQYLIVYSGSTIHSPVLGRYCNNVTVSNLISIKGLFIEYHTTNYEHESTFNLAAKVNSGCGGELSAPFRIIDFRKQYQNNIECIWTIWTRVGYYIGLKFTGRFFIESSNNCTKDYILIQEQSSFGYLDEWNDIQRLCGREPPAYINTTTKAIRFIFRSDDRGTGDGFTAVFDQHCGGVFRASMDKQLLSSPNFPSNYDSYLTCNYTIVSSDPNRAIILQLKEFELEDSLMGDCEFDNLTVYMSYKEPDVLCGDIDEHEFRSLGPITLVFQTDNEENFKGFVFEFGYEICGGAITSSTSIATPKYRSHSKYPGNSICIWNVVAPEGSKIMVKFEVFDFEITWACQSDFVEVFSGNVTSEDQRVAKLCGNLTGILPPLTIKSNLGIIQSNSDQRQPSVGFSALVNIMKNCDRDITLDSVSGTYTLDDFATGYDNDLDCGFLFRTNAGNQLVFEFTSFHIEESLDCKSDYVIIRDGSGLFADEIGRFCGHIIPNHVMSSRSSMYVQFVSDSLGNSSGFSAIVRVVPLACGAHELHVNSNSSITITSGEGGNYQPNMNCLWHLRSDSNIRLDFEKLDIQGPNENGTCTSDYLKIYKNKIENDLGSYFVFNGDFKDSSVHSSYLSHVFCGQEAPNGYSVNNQEVFIQFFSDSSIEKSGFKLIATASDGCFKNYTTTQGRILLDKADECNIYINAPQNYSISLYFNNLSFPIGDTNECVALTIEITDQRVNTTSVEKPRKICSSVGPSNSVFTTSNKLKINISIGIMIKYDFNFLASAEGPGCGGDIYNTAGIFTSPYYPENVRNNSICRWNIRVPNNMVVELQLKVFDLGSKVTCATDYLEIIEADEIVRKFCGEDRPRGYRSRGNVLSVRFRRTVYSEGTGWVVEFSGVRHRFSII